MTSKSVELAIFWLPLVAGVLLGGIAGSAWYGGDKIPAIWIGFFGVVCLLLTATLQIQQYAYANVLQPEIEIALPQPRYVLRWDPPREFNYVTRAEDRQPEPNGQSWSPVIVLNNKSSVFGQDAVATWTIAAIDNAALIAASPRLNLYQATLTGSNVLLHARPPITEPVGLGYQFPVAFKQSVPIPFLPKQVETFIPYNVWSQAILVFIATTPDAVGERSHVVTFEVSVKWSIPEGNRVARFRVKAVAVNSTVAGAPPTLAANIELIAEKISD